MTKVTTIIGITCTIDVAAIASLAQEVTRTSQDNEEHIRTARNMAEETFQTLSHVASTSEENAASAEEVVASSEKRSGALQEIDQTITEIVALMRKLKEDLGQFKI